MKYLYGKDIKDKYISSLYDFFKTLKTKARLAIVEVGENDRNISYLNSILKLANEIGVNICIYRIKCDLKNIEHDIEISEVYRRKYEFLSFDNIYTLKESIKDSVLTLLDNLNKCEEISGIILMSHLDYGLKYEEFTSKISYLKDVDCVTDTNVRHLMEKDYRIAPCTPLAVLTLLKENNIDITGKNCVIIGRSNVVGKPLGLMLMHENATVTFCNSKTERLNWFCKNSDILISAVGKPSFITEAMYNKGTIIDVGINFVDGYLVGDVKRNDIDLEVKGVQYFTPVPGGVGPLTTLMLFENLKRLIEEQKIRVL